MCFVGFAASVVQITGLAIAVGPRSSRSFRNYATFGMRALTHRWVTCPFGVGLRVIRGELTLRPRAVAFVLRMAPVLALNEARRNGKVVR
jgi:hypothetical protein